MWALGGEKELKTKNMSMFKEIVDRNLFDEYQDIHPTDPRIQQPPTTKT